MFCGELTSICYCLQWINVFYVSSPSSTVQLTCYVVQALLNRATVIAILAKYYTNLLGAIVGVMMWKSIRDKNLAFLFKNLKLNVLSWEDFHMVALTVNRQVCHLLASNRTSMILVCTSSPQHHYRRGYTCTVTTHNVIIHCKIYYTKFNPRQKIHAELFCQKVEIEVFVSDLFLYDIVYSDQVVLSSCTSYFHNLLWTLQGFWIFYLIRIQL